MVIGIDIMGGDYAPKEAIAGILSFLQNEDKASEVSFALFGLPEVEEECMQALASYKGKVCYMPCSQVIQMQEHPTKALKEKPESSIAKACGALAQGKIDALIGAGNTGAMLVGAMYSVKPIPGVARPTIASPIPKLNGRFNFLLDVGANADCKPEHLLQFAKMGALYARFILDLKQPKVALLNIGEEEGKGDLLSQAAYSLLKNCPDISFVGNKEGRDLFLDEADVFVCEGFVGNVVLKMAESIYDIFKNKRQVQDDFLEQFNYEIYGGTPILGVNAPLIIGHGIAHVHAFHAMINTAVKMVETKLVETFQKSFAQNDSLS